MDKLPGEVFTLTDLQYAEPGEGPWRLYLYGRDGFHSGSKWFRVGKMKYPDEEISLEAAQILTGTNEAAGLEVRITDGGDMLVYHSVNGRTVYGEKFWESIGGSK
jgi:hypothetical protein